MIFDAVFFEHLLLFFGRHCGEESEQWEAPCLEAADTPGAGHSCYLC